MACSSDPASEGTSSAGGSGSGGGGGAAAGHTEPLAEFLPKATGPCPALAQGKLTFTADGKPREVEIYMNDGASGGPLVFFWHGAGGSPTEATYALGTALQAIKDMGGIVAAPYHESTGVLPWYLSLGGADDSDVRVADEVLACAIAAAGTDVRRIHSVGFSAGAMHTTHFAALRSGYIASAVLYSGARLGAPVEQDEKNKYPAMLFHGGPDDQVVINFEDHAHQYHDALETEGHFSFLCNHGKGHTVPTDGRSSAWQFLVDHPFGASPEPYEKALPAGFPAYCAL
jgi:predicted esterase